MAGIGFELRRMLHGDRGIAGKLQAMLAATMITAGPWLVTMCTLLVVTLLGGGSSSDVQGTFRAIVTYAFAASMVTVGAVQMPMTRYIADLLHDGKYDRVLPAFGTATAGVAAFQGLTGLLFGLMIGLRDSALLWAVVLYVVVSLNWLAMAWLTVIRHHTRILIAFAVGLVCAIAASLGLQNGDGLAVPLMSYALGQGITFLFLTALIVRGLERGTARDPGVFRSVVRYPQLLGIGFCYGLGVWIDKIVFWAGDGISPAPFLLAHPLYDTSCFLAYVTVIPALALNLVVLETRFYEQYRRYHGALLDGAPLREVDWQRTEMLETLRNCAILLLRWQGLVTTLAIVFAPVILGFLGMPEGMARTFRFACLGAFFQVFLLIGVLVLLYFDLRKQALISTVVFLIANGGFAWLSLLGGYPAYGAGYAVAGFVGLFAVWRSLQRALPELEYAALTRAALRG